MRSLIPILSCVLAAGWAVAEDRAELVRPQFLADAASIRPGQTFRVGVLLEIKPGWHIYWKNPGDSGVATQVHFQVPQGFVVSALRWPVPVVFTQPGDLVGYGYSDAVLLWAEVTAPRDLRPGSEVALAIDTEWLCCQQMCVPGSRKLSLKLPVAETAQPANGEVFAQWERRLPIEAASAQSPFVPKIQGTLSADGQGGIAVQLDWKIPVKGVEWIPATPEALAVEDLAVVNRDQHTSISFKARVLRGQRLSGDTLESVVAYTDGSGERRGVLVRVPLMSSNQSK